MTHECPRSGDVIAAAIAGERPRSADGALGLHLVPWIRDACKKSRSAAPGWQGVTSENIGNIRARSNDARRDAPPGSSARDHGSRGLAGCEACRDLALVVSALRGERDRARREAPLASAGLVWRRAELRQRQEAACKMEDVRGILRERLGDLDVALIRSTLAALEDALGQSDLLPAFERELARRRVEDR